MSVTLQLVNLHMMTSSNGNIFDVTGHLCKFPTQRPVTRSSDTFFDLRLNKRLSKQWGDWWFETLSRPLWRLRNNVIPAGELWGVYLEYFWEDWTMTGELWGVYCDYFENVWWFLVSYGVSVVPWRALSITGELWYFCCEHFGEDCSVLFIYIHMYL